LKKTDLIGEFCLLLAGIGETGMGKHKILPHSSFAMQPQGLIKQGRRILIAICKGRERE
jgi:hypothetical protein